MKTDRELLELAAKAAGIELDEYWHELGFTTKGGCTNWNPLEIDGDALRLAVKLEMQLRLRHSENEVSAYGAPDGRIDEGVRGDPDAATRRAIVRAAAAIGEAMT